MTIRINSKPTSTQQALRSSSENKNQMDKTLEKLSSGRRLNRAADDAAGLAIANKLGEALKGLEQGMRNTYDGLSMAKASDGQMSMISQKLGRMRELTMVAANGTLSEEQRDSVQEEFEVLKEEISRVAESAEFNGTRLLDGSAGAVDIALGDGTGEVISLDLSHSLDADSLGLTDTRVDGSDGGNAQRAMEDIDEAMASVSSYQSELGAGSNRLASASRGLAITAENTYASSSRIMDADFAVETSNLVRQQILAQSSNAMLAQGKGLQLTALNLLK
ncbi:MAG: hypothetical protein KOO60_11660 [Gemmatimonadales bacterium]|nr:hypothetical protein [Gemmatimonadales bacterium]